MNHGDPNQRLRPLIIERADLQSFRQRWGYGTLTLACWIAWLYLFIPLLSAVAWFAGLTFIYRVLLQGLELAELWAMLTRYGSGIAVLVSVYMIWAVTSYLRFRRMERRKAVASVTDTELCGSHDLRQTELEQLRGAGVCTLTAEQLQRMFGEDRQKAGRIAQQ